MIEKIISGGQTGVDIAALIIAKEFEIPTGGWIPKGFKTQAGNKKEYAELYSLKETPMSDYPTRTQWNVRDSDGTIRMACNFNSAGEFCTLKAIKTFKKPYFDVDLCNPPEVEVVYEWLNKNNIKILNIAGNSEVTWPGIKVIACHFLNKLIKHIIEN